MKRRGGKDVGIANRRGTRDTSPLAPTRGVREVSTTRGGDCIAEADGSLMFPEVLRPAPGEGIRARLMIPHVGKVLVGATVGASWVKQLPLVATLASYRPASPRNRRGPALSCQISRARRWRAPWVKRQPLPATLTSPHQARSAAFLHFIAAVMDLLHF